MSSHFQEAQPLPFVFDISSSVDRVICTKPGLEKVLPKCIHGKATQESVRAGLKVGGSIPSLCRRDDSTGESVSTGFFCLRLPV